MKVYEVNNSIRTKVTLWIAVISLFLGKWSYDIGSCVMERIANCFPKLSAYLAHWDFLGVLPSQITAACVFSIIYYLFDRYIWKIPFVNHILGIPNLNGKWMGVLQSSYIENGVNKKVDMVLEIQQTWTKMMCTSIFPASKSYSDLIAISTNGSEGTMLKFTFTNHSLDLANGLPQFAGYNELRLNSINTLDGTYFTKREPSTT